MSGHDVHAHGPHDDEVEHQARHGPGLAQYVAIFTALLASLGAVVSYNATTASNEAMLYKHEAALKKAEASKQWINYQSKSTEGYLMQAVADLSAPAKAQNHPTQVERIEEEKREIERQAEALEEESRRADAESERLLYPSHRADQALTLIQVAISLASITVLTRKKWLFAFAGIAAAGGVILAGMSFFFA
ncbi:membrane protein [Sulfurifustis variabilis]|uniref:Membrane protein n=1 Tax=Sulfurifustis variabilis TaxID=1675686 RepID=A0A1C7AEY2_9GAMM|nr:DUF4337 family protein [Sulfurifustis variabilis]BAU49755.1 membrane protein [Sulfurifustis variabilis]